MRTRTAVPAFVVLGTALVLASCSSSHGTADGPPVYSLARTRTLLVTPSEAGLPTWRARATPGEQLSRTTLAIEYLSRTADGPLTDVSLEVAHDEAIVREVQSESAPSDKQDLRDVHTSSLGLHTGHGVVRASELAGYDTVLAMRQVKITFVIGPVLASVTGQDASVVEQVAEAQAAKLPGPH